MCCFTQWDTSSWTSRYCIYKIHKISMFSIWVVMRSIIFTQQNQSPNHREQKPAPSNPNPKMYQEKWKLTRKGMWRRQTQLYIQTKGQVMSSNILYTFHLTKKKFCKNLQSTCFEMWHICQSSYFISILCCKIPSTICVNATVETGDYC